MSNHPEHIGFFIAPLSADGTSDIFLSHPHRQQGNEFFFVTSGYLIRNCNFKDIRLNKDDFHLSMSRQLVSLSDLSPDLGGYYCRFEDKFLQQVYLKENVENDLEFISSFLFHYPLRLSKELAGRVEYFLSILLQLNREIIVNISLITTYLVAIIYEIKKMMVESGLDFYPSKAFLTTKRYNDMLAMFVDKERSLNFYAKQLKITPNHLNKSVKSVTGCTALSLLNEMSVQEAKMRLKYTNLTISEIAFQLGFEDLSYFSRFFKKATGISPIHYRKSEN